MRCILLAAAAAVFLGGCADDGGGLAADSTGTVTVTVITKIQGIEYFNAAEVGARRAAEELGVELVFDGPTENKVDRQIEMIDGWITRGCDVLAVSPNDPVAIAPVLRKALAHGIHVITWDADAEPDAREFFVNQASIDAIGVALVDVMAELAGPSAKTAIVTGSMTAANQNAWMDAMRAYMPKAFPQMSIVDVKPSEEDQQLAFRVTQDLLKAYPELDGVFGITSVALPGAADAVRQAGKTGRVAVTGLSTPGTMREWVRDGTVGTFVLWNPVDLGYLTVYAGRMLVDGTLTPETTEIQAGELGTIEVCGDEVLLGPPMRFDASNIDEFDF